VDTKRLLLGLNALLPSDIRVLKVAICLDTFHPTLDALGKEYRYHLMLGVAPHPLYATWLGMCLNFVLLKRWKKPLLF